MQIVHGFRFSLYETGVGHYEFLLVERGITENGAYK